ncbi:MAG: hypothetical protein JSS27_16485 [Planctomycetes bacterium]|nr:hypothetical protein [Planctomycetota bacterium]
MSLFQKTACSLVILAGSAATTCAAQPNPHPTTPVSPYAVQEPHIYHQPTGHLKPWQMPIVPNPGVYPFAYGAYGGYGVSYQPYYSRHGDLMRYPNTGLGTYGPYTALRPMWAGLYHPGHAAPIQGVASGCNCGH